MADTAKRTRSDVVDLTGDDSDNDGVMKRPRTTQTSDNQSPKPQEADEVPPRLAIIQAASTGNLQWLEQILQHFQGELTDAVVAAATFGHLKCMRALSDHLCDPDDDEHFIHFENQHIMLEAVLPAVKNKHTEVVKFVLVALSAEGKFNEEATWAAFREAAIRGCLEIVEFTVPHMTWADEFEHECSSAIINAIDGGHADVVAFLLGLEECHCDVGNAFMEAISKEQHAVAKAISKSTLKLMMGKRCLWKWRAADAQTPSSTCTTTDNLIRIHWTKPFRRRPLMNVRV